MRAQPFTAPVEYAGASVRADFIRRTSQHLAWAVLGFIVVEALLLQWPGAPALVRTMTGGVSWLMVLAAFMGVSWLGLRSGLAQGPHRRCSMPDWRCMW